MEERKQSELSEQELSNISGGKIDQQDSGLRDNARELRERGKDAAEQEEQTKGRSSDLGGAVR